jgi:hypothetical protein
VRKTLACATVSSLMVLVSCARPVADAPGGRPGEPGNPDPVPGPKVFGLGFCAPLAIPLVVASNLSAGWKTALSGARASSNAHPFPGGREAPGFDSHAVKTGRDTNCLELS